MEKRRKRSASHVVVVRAKRVFVLLVLQNDVKASKAHEYPLNCSHGIPGISVTSLAITTRKQLPILGKDLNQLLDIRPRDTSSYAPIPLVTSRE